jgi:hypothetical protein
MNIINCDEIMESEVFPMSPKTIAREQNKDTYFKEVMKKSDFLSERIIESFTVTTCDTVIYIYSTITQK